MPETTKRQVRKGARGAGGADRAIRDAILERVTGEEHSRRVRDSLNRLVHYEERDGDGKLLMVMNVAYMSDGSSITTVYDFSTTPATVTQYETPAR